MKKERFRTLHLPKLDLLNPTIESNLFKMTEELGEICTEVGKHRGLSGEVVATFVESEEVVLNNIAQETLDLIQACTTMLNLLETSYGVDIAENYKEHLYKLAKKKKYVSEDILDILEEDMN